MKKIIIFTIIVFIIFSNVTFADVLLSEPKDKIYYHVGSIIFFIFKLLILFIVIFLIIRNIKKKKDLSLKLKNDEK